MTHDNQKKTMAWQVFWWITAFPKKFILFGLVLVLGCAVFIPTLVKDSRSSDAFGRAITAFGAGVVRWPRAVLGVAALVGAVGIIGVTQLELNEARIRVFQKEESPSSGQTTPSTGSLTVTTISAA